MVGSDAASVSGWMRLLELACLEQGLALAEASLEGGSGLRGEDPLQSAGLAFEGAGVARVDREGLVEPHLCLRGLVLGEQARPFRERRVETPGAARGLLCRTLLASDPLVRSQERALGRRDRASAARLCAEASLARASSNRRPRASSSAS